MDEPIFCNDNIKIGNTTIFYKSWMDNGINCIGNTICANENLISFELFTERCRVNTNFITYTEYIHAIKAYILKTGLAVNSNKSIALTKSSQTYLFCEERGKGAL